MSTNFFSKEKSDLINFFAGKRKVTYLLRVNKTYYLSVDDSKLNEEYNQVPVVRFFCRQNIYAYEARS